MAGDKKEVVTEIADKEECMTLFQDVQGDINDVINHVDANEYGEALQELDDLQEKIDAAHVYLTTKAKE